MAKLSENHPLTGISGTLGKQLVMKQYDGYTVVSKYPDMSRVKATAVQKAGRKDFKKAVAYSQAIIRDPDKKAAYAASLPRGKRVYTAAIQEYLSKNNPSS